MMHDTLAAALSNIMNAEKVGKNFCTAKPFSKMLKEVLTLMNLKGYIGSFEIIEDGKGKIVKINLLGKVNNCGAIKPRFSVKKDDFEKFEKRYLPAKDFGIMIVSTSKGIMAHADAKEKKVGGKLIAYVY
ncbi:30S ribosomal protein S8 [Candidatus Woesearchaeota archaeon]|nr:30S ribosomal protein S8 [Candidatus Woesearchaeota archaeon]